jgi:hypothetical protein
MQPLLRKNGELDRRCAFSRHLERIKRRLNIMNAFAADNLLPYAPGDEA